MATLPRVRPARTLALSLALTLLAAAPAGAATYASPNGSGPDCTQASPCDLPTALTQAGAQSDKTAIALPGEYILTGTATVPNGVTLQGTPGADIAGPMGMAGVSTAGGTIERVVLEGFGTGGSAVHLTGGGTLVDTVAKGNGGADAVLSDSGGTLTNVTAYAAGGGAALHVAALALAWPAVDASILASDGSASAVHNESAQTPAYDHTDVGTDPLFVSPPNDLRLKPGSPAVDAGGPGDDPSGRLDPDGLPRQFGSAVDEGAYELTPPGVAAAPVSDVTAGGATLHGTVFPNARETQLSFVYGPTSAPFTSSQPVGTLPAGTAPVPVSQAISGLQPGTTYLVSLVASSSAGAQASTPISFATAPAPPAPIVLPPRHAATILLLGSNRVRVDSRRRWRVLIQCPKVELYPCQGVLAVRSVRSLRFGPGPKKRLVFGSLRFEVPAGATMRVGPTLTKARARLARGLRSTPVAVSVITQGAALADQRFFARRFTMLGPRR